MRSVLQHMPRLLAALLLLGCGAAAWAHKGSDAYLQVSDQPALSLRYSVAIKDLEMVVRMDANGDGQVTWGEIKAATPAISTVLTQEIGLADAAALQWQFNGLEARGDGAYVRFQATPTMPSGTALALRYALFKTEDATHRLLVAGQLGGQDLLLTLSPMQSQGTVLQQAAAPALSGATAETPTSRSAATT